jgi:hypothetical protein
MSPLSPAFRASAAVLLLAAGVPVLAASAQQRERRPAPAPVEAPEITRPLVGQMDAEATRNAFMEVLERHPPSVGRVMKLDPSLMRNEAYLEAYPQVREFLAAHPEVPLNPAYYLERIRGAGDWTPPDPQQQMAEAILAGLAAFTAMFVILGTLVWLIRTAIEHRRWNRLSKIQAEVHTKLMDRFSSNDELLAYVQTPSGRRFLESGPSPLQESAPAVGAPFSRILWSVQLGAVLLVTGIGLLFLSGRAIPHAREFFYIAGCLATAVGAGFLASAAAAYVLSRRLGLLNHPAQDHA